MANRSYLYSCNVIPGENEEKKLVGISEWNYDIPIVYKLLLSGNPQMCQSSIWDVEENIAIAGCYNTGVSNLSRFLDLIEREDAKELVKEASDFLSSGINKGNYFILECGEIFDMNGEDLAGQNQELFEELLNLDSSISRALTSIKQPDPKGFIKRLFSKKQDKPQGDPLAPIYALGLGNWSNILYYDFSNA